MNDVYAIFHNYQYVQEVQGVQNAITLAGNIKRNEGGTLHIETPTGWVNELDDMVQALNAHSAFTIDPETYEFKRHEAH